MGLALHSLPVPMYHVLGISVLYKRSTQQFSVTLTVTKTLQIRNYGIARGTNTRGTNQFFRQYNVVVFVGYSHVFVDLGQKLSQHLPCLLRTLFSEDHANVDDDELVSLCIESFLKVTTSPDQMKFEGYLESNKYSSI